MRENRMSGSMRGCWGLDTVELVRHREPKGAGTDRPDLPSGYQALLYPFSFQVPGSAEARGCFFVPRGGDGESGTPCYPRRVAGHA